MAINEPAVGRRDGETMREFDDRCRREFVERLKASATERDWPSEFSDENGCYTNLCLECRETFMGYKRRVVCRICAVDNDPL